MAVGLHCHAVLLPDVTLEVIGAYVSLSLENHVLRSDTAVCARHRGEGVMALLHDAPLLTTLATGLSFAFVGGIVASKLRLSPIVGYLLAGIMIGPFTPGIIANAEIASELAEIGIVLLMFGVGLHFSIQDLLKVNRIALPGAVGQILVSIAMGVGAAYVWGWPLETGFLMGLALSVASTVVLLRALEQHNILYSLNGRIAVGWLIVEDLVMVLALVLLPTLAPIFHRADAAFGIESWLPALGMACGKIILFMCCMLVLGKRALPWLLRLVAQTRSRELFTLAVFAVAIGIAFGAAELFGVSFALGAFFSGMMIRESDLSNEVADKALPFQDAFAVLFFVAVGMIFDPQILLAEPLQVLMVVLIIIVGKSVAAFLIVLLFRYPLRTALLVSASLAQIGEFSFILATLGMKYDLLTQDHNSLILAGALISISLNPLAFHAINGVYRFIASRPRLAQYFTMSESDRLSRIPQSLSATLQKPVVLIGYGHVGRKVHALIPDVPVVIIDLNRERIEKLREKNVASIIGDAGAVATLQNALLDRAEHVVITVRNPYETRRIVEAVLKYNPTIKILVRTETYVDFEYFNTLEVQLAVMGKQEVAHRMAEYINGVAMPPPVREARRTKQIKRITIG